MKITRIINGQEIEIELTEAEIEAVYREQENNYRMEDVRSFLIQRDVQLPEEKICELCDLFEHRLDKCEQYFEAYWDTLDYCYDELVKE